MAGLQALADHRVGFRALGIEGDKILLVVGDHAARKDRALRAGGDAGVAVNTNVRINKQHFRRLTESLYWAHIDATSVFVANTALGDYVSHYLLRT